MYGIGMYKDRWFAGTFLLLAMFSAQAAAPRTSGSFDELVETTVRRGPDGQLPPRLSVLLGLSALEQSISVKQAVIRGGSAVHVFNVCAANHDDLVILTHDDQDQSTKAYLVSTGGQLRKAVFFRAGEPAQVRSLSEARGDFAVEHKFWTNFSAKLPHAD
jgi:hypothetical protein